MRLEHEIDKSYNFSQQKSYSWTVPPISSSLQTFDKELFEIIRKNILECVDNNLLAKGYSQKQNNGDMLINVNLSTYANVSVPTVNVDDDPNFESNSSDVQRILIKVTITDKKLKKVVFESEVSDIMSKKQNRIHKLRGALYKLMAPMPKK